MFAYSMKRTVAYRNVPGDRLRQELGVFSFDEIPCARVLVTYQPARMRCTFRAVVPLTDKVRHLMRGGDATYALWRNLALAVARRHFSPTD